MRMGANGAVHSSHYHPLSATVRYLRYYPPWPGQASSEDSRQGGRRGRQQGVQASQGGSPRSARPCVRLQPVQRLSVCSSAAGLSSACPYFRLQPARPAPVRVSVCSLSSAAAPGPSSVVEWASKDARPLEGAQKTDARRPGPLPRLRRASPRSMSLHLRYLSPLAPSTRNQTTCCRHHLPCFSRPSPRPLPSAGESRKQACIAPGQESVVRGAGRHVREVKLSLPASPAPTCQPSTQSPSPNVTSRLTVLTSPHHYSPAGNSRALHARPRADRPRAR